MVLLLSNCDFPSVSFTSFIEATSERLCSSTFDLSVFLLSLPLGLGYFSPSYLDFSLFPSRDFYKGSFRSFDFPPPSPVRVGRVFIDQSVGFSPQFPIGFQRVFIVLGSWIFLLIETFLTTASHCSHNSHTLGGARGHEGRQL